MGWGSILAIYFVVWWTMLFVALPIGVRSQTEANAVTPGTDPGAPVAPRLAVKALITSIVAAVVTIVIVLFGGQLLD